MQNTAAPWRGGSGRKHSWETHFLLLREPRLRPKNLTVSPVRQAPSAPPVCPFQVWPMRALVLYGWGRCLIQSSVLLGLGFVSRPLQAQPLKPRLGQASAPRDTAAARTGNRLTPRPPYDYREHPDSQREPQSGILQAGGQKGLHRLETGNLLPCCAGSQSPPVDLSCFRGMRRILTGISFISSARLQAGTVTTHPCKHCLSQTES